MINQQKSTNNQNRRDSKIISYVFKVDEAASLFSGSWAAE